MKKYTKPHIIAIDCKAGNLMAGSEPNIPKGIGDNPVEAEGKQDGLGYTEDEAWGSNSNAWKE